MCYFFYSFLQTVSCVNHGGKFEPPQELCKMQEKENTFMVPKNVILYIYFLLTKIFFFINICSHNRVYFIVCESC